MPKKILKKAQSRFFDPIRTAQSPEEYLLVYLTQTNEMLLDKSADVLLKEAEDVFKKTKQINYAAGLITQDQIENANLKALEALKIAAEKYKRDKKEMEADCVYQLIVSQANRYLSTTKEYEAPRFY